MDKGNPRFGLQGITGKFIGASEAYIAELEQQSGFTLPLQYKDFLRNYGASIFMDAVEFQPLIPSPWAVNGAESFDGFYGMSERTNCDVLGVNRRLRNDLPADTIAIGNDPGANLILLSKSGEVLFFDRDSAKCFLCAKDFAGFLDSFRFSGL